MYGRSREDDGLMRGAHVEESTSYSAHRSSQPSSRYADDHRDYDTRQPSASEMPDYRYSSRSARSDYGTDQGWQTRDTQRSSQRSVQGDYYVPEQDPYAHYDSSYHRSSDQSRSSRSYDQSDYWPPREPARYDIDTRQDWRERDRAPPAQPAYSSWPEPDRYPQSRSVDDQYTQHRSHDDRYTQPRPNGDRYIPPDDRYDDRRSSHYDDRYSRPVQEQPRSSWTSNDRPADESYARDNRYDYQPRDDARQQDDTRHHSRATEEVSWQPSSRWNDTTSTTNGKKDKKATVKTEAQASSSKKSKGKRKREKERERQREREERGKRKESSRNGDAYEEEGWSPEDEGRTKARRRRSRDSRSPSRSPYRSPSVESSGRRKRRRVSSPSDSKPRVQPVSPVDYDERGRSRDRVSRSPVPARAVRSADVPAKRHASPLLSRSPSPSRSPTRSVTRSPSRSTSPSSPVPIKDTVKTPHRLNGALPTLSRPISLGPKTAADVAPARPIPAGPRQLQSAVEAPMDASVPKGPRLGNGPLKISVPGKVIASNSVRKFFPGDDDDLEAGESAEPSPPVVQQIEPEPPRGPSYNARGNNGFVRAGSSARSAVEDEVRESPRTRMMEPARSEYVERERAGGWQRLDEYGPVAPRDERAHEPYYGHGVPAERPLEPRDYGYYGDDRVAPDPRVYPDRRMEVEVPPRDPRGYPVEHADYRGMPPSAPPEYQERPVDPREYRPPRVDLGEYPEDPRGEYVAYHHRPPEHPDYRGVPHYDHREYRQFEPPDPRAYPGYEGYGPPRQDEPPPMEQDRPDIEGYRQDRRPEQWYEEERPMQGPTHHPQEPVVIEDTPLSPPPHVTEEVSPVVATPVPSAKSKSSSEPYTVLGQVGEGTFGKVYKAQSNSTGALVALKRIRMEQEKDGFPVTAMREIKLLQSLRHPNVVRLYEMMVSKGSVYMVFEYMDHDLTGVLLNQASFPFEDAHLKSFCLQMMQGLAYLHHKGVLHRDIKGSNILVNNNGELKLADFGLARFYNKHRRLDYTNRVITLWYRPPELVLGATEYGPEVDIWSAGCIMLELFTRKPVFQGNDELHQLESIYRVLGTPTVENWPGLTQLPWYEMIKSKDARPSRFQESFSKYLKTPATLDLASRLLTYDPLKRITAADALEHPYFTTEGPPPTPPVGMFGVQGEWHEYESKREREKDRQKQKRLKAQAAQASAAAEVEPGETTSA